MAEPSAPVRRPSLPPAPPRTLGGVQGTCRRGRAEPGHQATLQERHLEGEAAAGRAEREAHKPGLRTPGAQPTRPGHRSPPRRLARCQHPARSVLRKGAPFSSPRDRGCVCLLYCMPGGLSAWQTASYTRDPFPRQRSTWWQLSPSDKSNSAEPTSFRPKAEGLDVWDTARRTGGDRARICCSPGLPLPLSARTSPAAVSPEHSLCASHRAGPPGSMETSRGPGDMGVATHPLLAACTDGPPEQDPLFP